VAIYFARESVREPSPKVGAIDLNRPLLGGSGESPYLC